MMMIIIFGQGYELGWNCYYHGQASGKGWVCATGGDEAFHKTWQEFETALTSQFGTILVKVKIEKV